MLVILLFVSCLNKDIDPKAYQDKDLIFEIRKTEGFFNLGQLSSYDSLKSSIIENAADNQNIQETLRLYFDGFETMKAHDFKGASEIFGKVSNTTDYIPLKLQAQKFLASVNSGLGFNQKSIDSLTPLIKTYDGKVANLFLLEAKTILASCHNEFGQYDLAAAYLFDVKDVIEQPNFAWKEHFNYAYFYNILGLIMININKYDEAIQYFTNAFDSDYRDQNLSSLAKTYNNLSNALQKNGQRAAALDTLKKALAINKRIGRTKSMATNYYNLAFNHFEFYEKTGEVNEFKKSKYYYERGLHLCDSINFEYGTMFNSLGLGSLYFQSGDLNSAKPLLVTSYNISKKLDVKNDLVESLRLLTLIERSNLKASDFTYYFDEFFPLSKALEESKIQEKVNELVIKHEVEEKEMENTFLLDKLELQTQISRQNYLFIITLVILLLVVAIISFTLFRSSKRLDKANELLKRQAEILESKNRDLSRSINEKDQLAHTIIHDLRTPLVGVKGSLSLLENDISPNEIKEVTQLLKMSYSNLDILISSLLSNYQNENAVVTHSFTPTKMKDFMERILIGFEIEAQQKNIVIEKKLEDFTTKIKSDAIYGIVGNLTSNAIKYSPSHTNIKIETEFFQSFWRFTISDEGPGFTEQDQKNIFNQFANLSSQPTNNEKSTGLGLFSVKKSIESLKGTIELKNNPGKGATFVCQFPVNS